VVEKTVQKKHTALIRMLPAFVKRRIEHRPGLVKILDNIGWLFFDKILRMGVGLLVGVWMARYLGPEQFGQLNYAIAFVSLFGAIAGLGLKDIVVRDIVRDPQSATMTLGTAFILQIFAGLLAMLLVIVTIGLLKPNDEFIQIMVIIISITLVFKATDAIKYWFEAHVQSRYVVWIENGVFVLMAMFRVAMILTEASLMVFVLLTLVETLVISIGMAWIYTVRSSLSGLFQASISRAKTLITNSWPLLLSAIAVTLYMRIDMVMLEEMSSRREVGIYAAAIRISEVWYFLPTIIISSVSPSIISCHGTDLDLYLQRLKGLYFIMVWLALGVSIPVVLFSDMIMNILFGTEFKDAASVLAIHLWASVAVFLGVASSQHLLVEQLQKISFYRTFIGLVCNVILNIILIPAMGAKGAAMATVISYFIATFSLIFFKLTRKHALYLLLSPITTK
jgi:O-antigen/teichoic acid export membrane protein